MTEPEDWEDVPREELIERIQELEENKEEESVVFFEPQREIILTRPEEQTLNEMSEIAHLDTSSGEHYKFKVKEMDIWNSDLSLEELKEKYTRIVGSYPNFLNWLERTYERQEVFSIEHEGTYHSLVSNDVERMEWARSIDEVRENLSVDLTDKKSRIAMGAKSRAKIKEVLLKKGYPVEDNSKFRESGEKIGADLNVELRDYQKEYVERAHEKKAAVLANPAGSGKTVTAIGLMAKIDSPTLILVPQRSLVGQWKREILDKTTLTEDQIGEYHGDEKEMKDVTIATYHMAGEKTSLFRREWGLIVFDECLTGDTAVETREGRKSFEELDEELDLDEGWNQAELEVKSFDGDYFFDEVKKIYKSKAPVQRIHTETGKKLKATASHTHMVFDSESFEIKQKKFIEEGDTLLQPLIRENEKIEERPRAELMGWFIGDGHINSYGNGKFSFGRKAEEQLEILKKLHEKLGMDYSVFENNRGDLTLYSPELEERLSWSGETGNKVSDIRVPSEVFNSSGSEIGSLLRGLFDAEGSVDKKGRIQINTVSEKLAKDIDLLLQKLGIMTRKQEIERENEEHSKVHRLIIPTYYNDIFSDKIGFRLDHKEERVEKGVEPATGIQCSEFLNKLVGDLGFTERELAEMMDISRATVNGVKKGEHRLGQTKLQKLGQSLREFSETEFDSIEDREKFGITYRQISEIEGSSTSTVYKKAEENNPEILSSVEKILSEKKKKAESYAEKIEKLQYFNLLKITNIEEIGEKTVYDLETDSHRFIADGFLTHNCHHMPAKMFRKTASLQSTRRIGLSASPVREDSKEKEIFALIGQEVGGDWARFFNQEYVLKPDVEIQLVEWESDFYRNKYNEASGFKKAIIASKNPRKIQYIEDLLEEHEDEKTVLFCDWLEQGEELAEEFDIPFISGETDFEEREDYFDKFREGEIKTIIVSRIGDEGLDLPDAEVGIIASGQGGSRRQATQRAGRVMRPFGDAQVYIIATKGSNEEDFVKRQVEHLKEKGVPVTVEE